MRDKKLARISKDFEITARQLYPFAKSLYHITTMMNKKMREELYGVTNGKFIKVKKR
jgi:hypothetical protein